MAEPSRYNVGGVEAPSEILKNKLGIKDQKALEDTESVLFSATYEYFLGPLYSWAGKARTVLISKDGVLFCKAAHIESALKALLRKGWWAMDK